MIFGPKFCATGKIESSISSMTSFKLYIFKFISIFNATIFIFGWQSVYQIFHDNNATCNGPTAYPIRDKSECDLATESLSSELYHVVGPLSTNENEENNPKGCHFSSLDKRVYWNSHPVGTITQYSRRICKYPGDFSLYHFKLHCWFLILLCEHILRHFSRVIY